MTVQDEKPVKHLKVAIIGGGPGGLSTAIALSRIPNVEVALYEQAKVLREVGAGISIGPNTWNVLEVLGVADSLKSGHPTDTVLNMYVRSYVETNPLMSVEADTEFQERENRRRTAPSGEDRTAKRETSQYPNRAHKVAGSPVVSRAAGDHPSVQKAGIPLRQRGQRS